MAGPAVTIAVPPELPEILKRYTKAAIKTQPADVLAWSAAYFRAMANGEQPPVREDNENIRLTPGILRILNRQLGPKVLTPVASIETKWNSLALSHGQFEQLVKIGRFDGNIQWLHFFALGCSSLAENMLETMKLVCELLSANDDGSIPLELFYEIYEYLAKVDGTIKAKTIKAVRDYLDPLACKQDGLLLVQNFYDNRHCPALFETD